MNGPPVVTAELRAHYEIIFANVSGIINIARKVEVRSLNIVMTATYWLIGCRIVEFELAGKKRADYGVVFIQKLATDLTQRFGRDIPARISNKYACSASRIRGLDLPNSVWQIRNRFR